MYFFEDYLTMIKLSSIAQKIYNIMNLIGVKKRLFKFRL